MKRILATLSLLAAMAGAQAAIVNHADVNGIRTFEDTSTGYIWADLDIWLQYRAPVNPIPLYQFGGTYAGMLAALQAAGFTWADSATVSTMMQGADLDNNYAGVNAAIQTDWGDMIEVIRGYSDGGGGQFYQQQVQYGPNGPFLAGSLPPGGNPQGYADLWGMWAYMPGAPVGGGGGNGNGNVPEPASLALVGLALTALAARRPVRR